MGVRRYSQLMGLKGARLDWSNIGACACLKNPPPNPPVCACTPQVMLAEMGVRYGGRGVKEVAANMVNEATKLSLGVELA